MGDKTAVAIAKEWIKLVAYAPHPLALNEFFTDTNEVRKLHGLIWNVYTHHSQGGGSSTVIEGDDEERLPLHPIEAGGETVRVAFAAVKAGTATAAQRETVAAIAAGQEAGGETVRVAFAAVEAGTATAAQRKTVAGALSHATALGLHGRNGDLWTVEQTASEGEKPATAVCSNLDSRLAMALREWGASTSLTSLVTALGRHRKKANGSPRTMTFSTYNPRRSWQMTEGCVEGATRLNATNQPGYAEATAELRGYASQKRKRPTSNGEGVGGA